MKNRTIRMLCLLLCAAMLLSAAPVLHANAAEELTLTERKKQYNSIETDYEDNEKVHYTFSTFADLKEFDGKSFDKVVLLIYVGSEPLVIEENLTLLVDALDVSNMVIPAGVTLNTENASILSESVLVNGTLNCECIDICASLTVNGILICDDVTLFDYPRFSGRDNICFRDEYGCINWVCEADSMPKLKEALTFAVDGDDEYFVIITTDLTINQSIVVPLNCTLQLGLPTEELITVILTPNCILKCEGVLMIPSTFYVQGTLVTESNADIHINCHARFQTTNLPGELILENGGEYRGSGTIYVTNWNGVTQPEDALIGLDLSKFRIETYDSGWSLHYIGDEVAPQLVAIYSMFNPTTQEHLFVMEGEIAVLESYGWLLDGISFYSGTEGLPVYRLYNGIEHFYTYSEDEKAACIAAGWTYDGILCFTQTDGILLYCLFNESNGLHYYSAIQSIIDSMVADGWKLEGPAWFAANP